MRLPHCIVPTLPHCHAADRRREPLQRRLQRCPSRTRRPPEALQSKSRQRRTKARRVESDVAGHLQRHGQDARQRGPGFRRRQESGLSGGMVVEEQLRGYAQLQVERHQGFRGRTEDHRECFLRRRCCCQRSSMESC
ncbi:hypothetical protein IscW_ISCW019079 [Ixodes scapularis]|uniref:Uncharacterized protein n=1 Tax=Ixodes scapularis TaxID=6945 RepID=B7PQN8_IXOSC|nr:hypothetical protein IscW_ISCW019079 [Ixodes scapularis]|eukprot:XP_002436080.1 hypothetical protein IscW_ISCW019079 [Ixodes scapularis]